MMRNIQFADELIKRTFGESKINGIVRRQFNTTDKHVTWATEFHAYDAVITCTVSKAGSKYKVSGDNVPKDFVINQYEKVEYIRQELFKDEIENPDQLSIEDINENQKIENKSLFDSGEAKIEELSKEEVK